MKDIYWGVLRLERCEPLSSVVRVNRLCERAVVWCAFRDRWGCCTIVVGAFLSDVLRVIDLDVRDSSLSLSSALCVVRGC